MLRTSRGKTKKRFNVLIQKSASGLILFFAMFAAGILFLSESHQPIPFTQDTEQELRIWFFDIGQGHAVFLEMPTGEQILVDGGPSATILSKLGSVMFPWDRTIDAIVLTHPDADHMTGLVPVLENYEVKNVYETGVVAYTPQMKAFSQAVENEDTNHHLVSTGQEIYFGDVKIEIISPEDPEVGMAVEDRNNASTVLLISYGETNILLTGDAEKDAESIFASQVGDIDAFQVGHHGSMSSTTRSLLDEINAEVAIIQVGKDNSYGHPHPVVIGRLLDYGIRILRTDLDGDILFQSLGLEPEIHSSPLPF